jgi:hypothetical protein
MFAKTGPVVSVDSVSAAVLNPNLAVGHSGGFSGINSQLDIYVDSGYIVAAMSNIDNGASPLANRIGRTLARVKAK